ncbi:unnamed protein product [Rhodiola kirilowii]
MKKEIQALEDNGTWTLEQFTTWKKRLSTQNGFTESSISPMEKSNTSRHAW